MDFNKHLRRYETDEICRFYSEKDSAYVVIDWENHSQVHPYTVYDQEKKCNETFVDIIPGKKYFVFNIKPKSDVNLMTSALRICKGFFWGKYGLELNWLQAAEWFMQSDDPEVAYYLGIIFLRDPLLRDIKLARDFIEKAVENNIRGSKKLLQEINSKQLDMIFSE